MSLQNLPPVSTINTKKQKKSKQKGEKSTNQGKSKINQDADTHQFKQLSPDKMVVGQHYQLDQVDLE